MSTESHAVAAVDAPNNDTMRNPEISEISAQSCLSIAELARASNNGKVTAALATNPETIKGEPDCKLNSEPGNSAGTTQPEMTVSRTSHIEIIYLDISSTDQAIASPTTLVNGVKAALAQPYIKEVWLLLKDCSISTSNGQDDVDTPHIQTLSCPISQLSSLHQELSSIDLDQSSQKILIGSIKPLSSSSEFDTIIATLVNNSKNDTEATRACSTVPEEIERSRIVTDASTMTPLEWKKPGRTAGVEGEEGSVKSQSSTSSKKAGKEGKALEVTNIKDDSKSTLDSSCVDTREMQQEPSRSSTIGLVDHLVFVSLVVGLLASLSSGILQLYQQLMT